MIVPQTGGQVACAGSAYGRRHSLFRHRGWTVRGRSRKWHSSGMAPETASEIAARALLIPQSGPVLFRSLAYRRQSCTWYSMSTGARMTQRPRWSDQQFTDTLRITPEVVRQSGSVRRMTDRGAGSALEGSTLGRRGHRVPSFHLP